MATNGQHPQSMVPAIPWQTRTHEYYSKYPPKANGSMHHWWTRPRRALRYVQLLIAGVILLVIGGIFPLLISYELFFKPLLTITCQQCQIINATPYFAVDYILATVVGVLGFMMPLFVVIILVKVLRNRMLFHDLFD
jgi:hypothetical protein